MKANHQIFGLPKQLYQTSYTTLDSSRSSSLNNSNFTHSVHHHNAHPRPQKPSPVLLIRQIPRNNLSGSQANPQDFRPISPPREYYGENSKGEDMLKQIQQKLQEMSRKVSKNTEDINVLKSKEKVVQPVVEGKFIQELQKIQEKQGELSKDCLLRITTLREEVCEMAGKSIKMEQEVLDRIGTRFDEKQLIKVRSIIEERVKQQTAKIRLIIENETNKMVHDLKWELKRDQIAINPIKSKLKYPFKSLKLTYKQYLDVGKKDKGRLSTRQSSESPRSGTVRIGNELTYFVDKQGYLLDEDNCYLLDDNENLIRLNSEMLEQLRREGLLKQ